MEIYRNIALFFQIVPKVLVREWALAKNGSRATGIWGAGILNNIGTHSLKGT